MNAIIYTRTACGEKKTDKGLKKQKRLLKKYCEINKIKILKHFEEVFSGVQLNRPELNRLFEFVIKNKVDKIIVTKWNRLSRNFKQVCLIREMLLDMDIEITSLDNVELTELNFLITNI